MRRLFATIFSFIVLQTATIAAPEMTFSFPHIQPAVKTFSDGSTLIQFPVGTDLSHILESATISVGGERVRPSDISPNPALADVSDGAEITFTYREKNYTFHFSEGRYFTAIMMSDAHLPTNIDQREASFGSVSRMQNVVNNMINMGTADGTVFQFDALPGFVPTCDIVFNLGDMDWDNVTEASQSNFPEAFSGFYKARIPFVLMTGNHDLNSYTTLDSAYAAQNDFSLRLVSAYLDTLKMVCHERNLDLGDIKRFRDNTTHTQPEAWTFTFNGIRFYCGQTYFFEHAYAKSGGNYYRYAPDGIINSLRTFVLDEERHHPATPAVWMQHYSFYNYRSTNVVQGIHYYWSDGYGGKSKNKTTHDTSVYFTHQKITSDSICLLRTQQKRDSLLSIISHTYRPTFFSGHAHKFLVSDVTDYACDNDLSTNRYFANDGATHIIDYTVTSAGADGKAYIVLMKENKGVIEVKEANFSNVSNGITVVRSQKNADNRIYNLHGVAVGTGTKALPSGIYIRNEKKLIVR